MEALEQILEVAQFVAALALLYFAWKSGKSVRTPALLLGVIYLLISVPPFYFAPPSAERMLYAVLAIGCSTLAAACMAWMLSRLK